MCDSSALRNGGCTAKLQSALISLFGRRLTSCLNVSQAADARICVNSETILSFLLAADILFSPMVSV